MRKRYVSRAREYLAAGSKRGIRAGVALFYSDVAYDRIVCARKWTSELCLKIWYGIGIDHNEKTSWMLSNMRFLCKHRSPRNDSCGSKWLGTFRKLSFALTIRMSWCNRPRLFVIFTATSWGWSPKHVRCHRSSLRIATSTPFVRLLGAFDAFN